MESANRNRAALYLAILAVAASALALFLPKIPQDPAYHHFADTRCFLGIPNTMDVLSNIPLQVLGVCGIWLCRREGRCNREIRMPAILFFAAVLLTGIGSFIYHWHPDNNSIVWDRIPLSLLSMLLFLIVLADRIGPEIAARFLLPFLLAGPATVVYWQWSETQGAGDLRFYGIVQLLPVLLIPAAILLRPEGSIKNSVLWKVFACYGLARLFELLDGPVFQWTGWISGHTIKHLLAGVTVYLLLGICRKKDDACLNI